MNKFHNRKITIDGIVFDSVHEGQRWCELRLMQRAGEIRDLERQVKFVLIPAQYEALPPTSQRRGKCLERECAYIADFVYFERGKDGWHQVVEDAKGMKTPEYRIKKKLMLKEYGIRIKEV